MLFGISTEVNPEHSWKAPAMMFVTPLGIVIEVSPVQPRKQSASIYVILLGIVIDVSPVQSRYLQPIITQYFIDNKSEIWLLFLIAHSKR